MITDRESHDSLIWGNIVKRKKLYAIIILIIVTILIWAGWNMKTNMMDKNRDLSQLKSEDIEKIHGYFYSDSYNGENDSRVEMTREQIEKFAELMNQVKLGKVISEKKAQSVGASITYTVTMKGGTKYILRPGQYFQINDTYYIFRNYDKLWEKFFAFNSSWQPI